MLLDRQNGRDLAQLWKAPLALGALAVVAPTLLTVFVVDVAATMAWKLAGAARKHVTGPLLDYLVGRPMR